MSKTNPGDISVSEVLGNSMSRYQEGWETAVGAAASRSGKDWLGKPALLVLADGSVFEGEAFGASPSDHIAVGELVFNTSMTGYQEVITDPSYAGQVIAFTYPHIGNYGVNPWDDEARKPYCEGVVVRELSRTPSNWRARADLHSFLEANGVPGIYGVDTRRLTKVIRSVGAIPCAFGTASENELITAATEALPTDGRDLVSSVTTSSVYKWRKGQGHEGQQGTPPPMSWTVLPRSKWLQGQRVTAPLAKEKEQEDRQASLHVVVYDFGVKKTMLDRLACIADVTVVPAFTSAEDVLSMQPNGVVLSNGPGDPSALDHLVEQIADLIGKVPMMGICLGHQLLAKALGGRTYKLPFGHHGSNHPVKYLATGEVEITSQNHNYAVDPASVPNIEITHLNLNDGVLEGMSCSNAPAFSVQYHPEAGPGPHDSRYLFDRFLSLMNEEADPATP